MKIRKAAVSAVLAFIFAAFTLTAAACTGSSGSADGSDSIHSSDSADGSDGADSGEEEIVLRLVRDEYEVAVGESADIEIELTQGGQALPTDGVRYASSDEEVMTAEGGKITGVAEGDAVLTVTYGSLEETASVRVYEHEIFVRLDCAAYDLLLDEASLGSAVVDAAAFEDGAEISGAEISYSVADPDIAEIAADGTLTARAHGTTTLSATYRDVTETAVVRVWANATQDQVESFDEAYVNRFGRQYITNMGLHVDQVASGIELSFYGTELTAEIYATAGIYVRVFVDGDEEWVFTFLKPGTDTYPVAQGLEEGIHTVRILKSSEIYDGTLIFRSFSSEQFLRTQEKSSLKIEFVGDSITTGYGVLAHGGGRTVENSDATKSYAYLAAQALGADFSCVAVQGICVKAYHWQRNINMTEIYDYISPLTKDPYDFSADADTDVIVLNLGTNEGSYINAGHADYASAFPQDYADFVRVLRERHPDAYIVCTYGMMGQNSLVDQGIRQAVQSMQDDKIIYLSSPVQDTSGANGHPDRTAQERFSDVLVMYIEELLGL